MSDFEQMYRPSDSEMQNTSSSSQYEYDETDPSSPDYTENGRKNFYHIVQRNGQRIYRGPPADWFDSPPPFGTEIFVGRIPREFNLEHIIPIFEKIGTIYELRLLMDFSRSNRGFGFVRYTTVEDAQKAVRTLDNFKIGPNHYLGVMMSVDNSKLWISPIPTGFNELEVMHEMEKVTEDVVSVTLHSYKSNDSRLYAIVEYSDHRSASLARRKLIPTNELFGQRKGVIVEWARDKPTCQYSLKASSLFVGNVGIQTLPRQIYEAFSNLTKNSVTHVDKVSNRNYAFVHYRTHEAAESALKAAKNLFIGQNKVVVYWSKHLNNQKRKTSFRFSMSISSPTSECSVQHNFSVPPPTFYNQNPNGSVRSNFYNDHSRNFESNFQTVNSLTGEVASHYFENRIVSDPQNIPGGRRDSIEQSLPSSWDESPFQGTSCEDDLFSRRSSVNYFSPQSLYSNPGVGMFFAPPSGTPYNPVYDPAQFQFASPGIINISPEQQYFNF